MSKGALKELLCASVERFTLMIQDVPELDKTVITKEFQDRVNILEADIHG